MGSIPADSELGRLSVVRSVSPGGHVDLRAVPILPARDLEATRAFFERMGFRTVGWWPDAFGGYAIIINDTLEMHFFRFPELDVAASYAQCYWRVADADAVYRTVIRAGVTASQPEDKAWGMREFALSDPNGTLVRVGHALPARSTGAGALDANNIQENA